ncbi:MAG: hypothetical protein JNL92_18715 [Opitutaceae bacterium]|nr:hypothetical protein [Opitutaceae bacterium]
MKCSHGRSLTWCGVWLATALAAAAADSYDWLLGTWDVTYRDQAKGDVSAVAIVTPPPGGTGLALKDACITVRPAEASQAAVLVSRDVRLVNGTLTVTFGERPAVGARPGSAGSVVAVSPGTTELTATAGDAFTTLNIGPPAQPLVIELAVPGGALDGTQIADRLEGKWSQATALDGKPGRRAGAAQGSSRRGGNERWLRRPIQVSKAEILDYDWRLHSAQPAWPADLAWTVAAYGEDLGTVASLRIKGRNLPAADATEGPTLIIDDANLVPLPDWKRTAGGSDEAGDQLEVRVLIMRDVRPGPKEFTLDGVRGAFEFRLLGPDPKVDFFAWGTEESVDDSVATEIQLGLLCRAELELPAAPFYRTRAIALKVGGQAAATSELEVDPTKPTRLVSATAYLMVAPDTPERLSPQPTLAGEAGKELTVHPADGSVAWGRIPIVEGPVTKPRIALRPAGSAPREGGTVSVVLPLQPFRVEVELPGAASARAGDAIEIEVEAPASDTRAKIALTRLSDYDGRPARSGAQLYRLPADSGITHLEAGTLTLEALERKGVKKVSGSPLVFRYETAMAAVTPFDSVHQARLTALRQQVIQIQVHLTRILSEFDRVLPEARKLAAEFGYDFPPSDGTKDKDILGRKLQMTRNALELAGRTSLSERERVVYLRRYLDVLLPPNGSEFTPADGTSLGLQYRSREEALALATAVREAEDERKAAMLQLFSAYTQTNYQLLATFSGAGSLWRALDGTDIWGNRLSVVDRLSAGAECVLAVIAVYALPEVIKAVSQKAEAVLTRVGPVRTDRPPGRLIGTEVNLTPGQSLPASLARQRASRAIAELERSQLVPGAAANFERFASLSAKYHLGAGTMAAGEALVRGVPPARIMAAFELTPGQLAAEAEAYVAATRPWLQGKARATFIGRRLGEDGVGVVTRARASTAAAMMERLGIPPADAANAGVTAAGLTSNPVIGAIGGAWSRGIPASRVMNQLKLSEAQVAEALDQYLREAQRVANPAQRQQAVATFLKGSARAPTERLTPRQILAQAEPRTAPHRTLLPLPPAKSPPPPPPPGPLPVREPVVEPALPPGFRDAVTEVESPTRPYGTVIATPPANRVELPPAPRPLPSPPTQPYKRVVALPPPGSGPLPKPYLPPVPAPANPRMPVAPGPAIPIAPTGYVEEGRAMLQRFDDDIFRRMVNADQETQLRLMFDGKVMEVSYPVDMPELEAQRAFALAHAGRKLGVYTTDSDALTNAALRSNPGIPFAQNLADQMVLRGGRFTAAQFAAVAQIGEAQAKALILERAAQFRLAPPPGF